MNHSKYALYLNTVQGTAIKTLTEALKEVLYDVTLHFNSDGLEIMSMDSAQISFVSLKLNAKEFEEFYCPCSTLVGVNMFALHKLLKTIGNNDTVSLYVTLAQPNVLGINIQNKKKRINNNIYYTVIDVNVIEFAIPDIDYDSQVTMPCSDFQKYCRELVNISDFVTISVSRDKIFSMFVDGKFASQKLDIEESEDSNVVIEVKKQAPKNNTIGTYSLKCLNLFCKSSTLCNTICLQMKAEMPIIIIYSVASLGTCKFCLGGQVSEEDD